LIANQLETKAIYSCIRVCRSIYSSFILSLWNDLVVMPYQGTAIDVTSVQANAHWVKKTHYSALLTEEYYTITFPRLTSLLLETRYKDEEQPNYLQVQPHQKVQFARLNPTIKRLTYCHKDKGGLPSEFWEVVKAEWGDFEYLNLTGVVEADAVEAFWRACDRVQDLHLTGMDIPESSTEILSTLSFRQLRQLTVRTFSWNGEIPPRMWPLHLLERVKGSVKLRQLDWDVEGVRFPVQLVLEALAEGCWPELCKFRMGDSKCSDQDLARILRALTSGKLIWFRLSNARLGPLTFGCLRELYFDHLRELNLGYSHGVLSEMVQEVLVECVHLITLDIPHIFVRDIATASKPWGCLELQELVVFIAKQSDDEDGWDSRVFEQISRLRRLRILDLTRDPHISGYGDEPRPRVILDLETLDLSLPPFKPEEDSCQGHHGGRDYSNMRCWSSLVQLSEFSFDGDREMLGMEELLWMVDHWKELWCVTGEFRGIEDDEKGERDRLLRERRISNYE
ncbi:hypothetical protein BGX29_010605, partial [Mortierella sp. GBA35]